jgi:hypothetical protein
MFNLLGTAAILNVLNKLNTVLGARKRSVAVDLRKPLQPAVHGEISDRRGEISQSPRGLLIPVRLACRIHPAARRCDRRVGAGARFGVGAERRRRDDRKSRLGEGTLAFLRRYVGAFGISFW